MLQTGTAHLAWRDVPCFVVGNDLLGTRSSLSHCLKRHQVGIAGHLAFVWLISCGRPHCFGLTALRPTSITRLRAARPRQEAGRTAMHRVWQTALCLAAVSLCLGSGAHGADDIITWIRKCGGTVRFPCQ